MSRLLIVAHHSAAHRHHKADCYSLDGPLGCVAMRGFAAPSLLFLCTLGACGGGTAVSDLAVPADAAVNKAANCASTFGTALTDGFGRVDGTIVAVVPPADNDCAMPNSDHLVLQVSFGGATYRMVVNVMSDDASTDTNVRMFEIDAPLVGPAFAAGWHAPASFDYVANLQAHSTQFMPHDLAALTQLITAELEIGAPVSVFSTSSGGASSHLVHRNLATQDGAIVVNPTTAPHWLLFAFADQTF
jgi:hypothetical protein